MRLLTRRLFLRISSALAVVALGLPRRAGAQRDEIVLFRGWVLRASDIPEDRR